MKNQTYKLIHLAKIFRPKKGRCYLLLKEKSPHFFVWYEETENGDQETGVSASTIEEAIRLARRRWKNQGFCTVNCGFRYTLPERDEHGINAIYYQAEASYLSSNGIYFDESFGFNCFVQNASLEALNRIRKKD